ncbi:MAG: hypothetical protein M1834_004808 [Cirrosporium novae-zelandiae]|nr:MAG: hypothetical protein M1834_004808 [Cirrosporium novae-zelandiae]
MSTRRVSNLERLPAEILEDILKRISSDERNILAHLSRALYKRVEAWNGYIYMSELVEKYPGKVLCVTNEACPGNYYYRRPEEDDLEPRDSTGKSTFLTVFGDCSDHPIQDARALRTLTSEAGCLRYLKLEGIPRLNMPLVRLILASLPNILHVDIFNNRLINYEDVFNHYEQNFWAVKGMPTFDVRFEVPNGDVSQINPARMAFGFLVTCGDLFKIYPKLARLVEERSAWSYQFLPRLNHWGNPGNHFTLDELRTFMLQFGGMVFPTVVDDGYHYDPDSDDLCDELDGLQGVDLNACLWRIRLEVDGGLMETILHPSKKEAWDKIIRMHPYAPILPILERLYLRFEQSTRPVMPALPTPIRPRNYNGEKTGKQHQAWCYREDNTSLHEVKKNLENTSTYGRLPSIQTPNEFRIMDCCGTSFGFAFAKKQVAHWSAEGTAKCENCKFEEVHVEFLIKYYSNTIEFLSSVTEFKTLDELVEDVLGPDDGRVSTWNVWGVTNPCPEEQQQQRQSQRSGDIAPSTAETPSPLVSQTSQQTAAYGTTTTTATQQQQKAPITCYYCSKQGHTQNRCWKKYPDKNPHKSKGGNRNGGGGGSPWVRKKDMR